jgi:CBS domain-containing protein
MVTSTSHTYVAGARGVRRGVAGRVGVSVTVAILAVVRDQTFPGCLRGTIVELPHHDRLRRPTMRISDVLRSKSTALVTLSPDATVRDLVDLLAEHNIGAVIVGDDANPVAGIVSERDVVRGLVSGTAILDSFVADIMTTTVKTAAPTDSVDDLMRIMTEHRIRHVPVVVDGQLKGIVSIGDVVKSRIGELEFERDQLESYVHTQ